MPDETKKTLIKPVACAAGIVGTIESLLWIAASIICILIYNDSFIIDLDELNKQEPQLAAIFYLCFSGSVTQDVIVTPQVFNIFMYLYLAFSLILLTISFFVVWGMLRDKWKNQWQLFIAWSSVMIATSIIDIVFLSLVAADFNITNVEDVLIRTAYIIIITLAARGYILWIVNIVFAGVLLNFALYLKNKENDQQPRRTLINAYATGSTPPWKVDNYTYEEMKTLEFTNRAYEPDDENRGFRRSQSFFNATGDEKYLDKTNNNPSLRPFTYGEVNNSQFRGLFILNPDDLAERNKTPDKDNVSTTSSGKFAKIGKPQQQGRYAPPKNVPPPFIPDPDYTPPGSLRRKSVLKTTSNYNF